MHVYVRATQISYTANNCNKKKHNRVVDTWRLDMGHHEGLWVDEAVGTGLVPGVGLLALTPLTEEVVGQGAVVRWSLIFLV